MQVAVRLLRAEGVVEFAIEDIKFLVSRVRGIVQSRVSAAMGSEVVRVCFLVSVTRPSQSPRVQ